MKSVAKNTKVQGLEAYVFFFRVLGVETSPFTFLDYDLHHHHHL